MNTRRTRGIAMAVLATIALVACGGDDDEVGSSSTSASGNTAPAPVESKAITVALPNPSAIALMPVYLADAAGFYAEEGLEVEIVPMAGSAPVVQALVSGQAQIGAPGPGPVLAARERGQDVRFVYNLFPTNVFRIAALTEVGIADVEGLRGKTIGVGTAESAEVDGDQGDHERRGHDRRGRL